MSSRYMAPPPKSPIRFRGGAIARAFQSQAIDPDDFGPEVGKHHGAERTGPKPGHLDYSNSSKRPHHELLSDSVENIDFVFRNLRILADQCQ